MPDLIDNYTTVIPTPAATAVQHEQFRLFRSTASVTLSALTEGIEYTLNSKIKYLLDEYAELQDNWDGEDAKAPNPNAIDTAHYLASHLEKIGQPIFHAAPGPNGEIMLDIRNSKNSRSLEIILYKTRRVIVLFPTDSRPTQEDFNPKELPKFLAWLNQNV